MKFKIFELSPSGYIKEGLEVQKIAYFYRLFLNYLNLVKLIWVGTTNSLLLALVIAV